MNREQRKIHAEFQKENSSINKKLKEVRRLINNAQLAKAKGLSFHELRRLAFFEFKKLPQNIQNQYNYLINW